jgi:hypothetical protein
LGALPVLRGAGQGDGVRVRGREGRRVIAVLARGMGRLEAPLRCPRKTRIEMKVGVFVYGRCSR